MPQTVTTAQTRALDTAINYMASEHNRLLQLRDELHVVKRRALNEGRIGDALDAERTAALLHAELSGVDQGHRQLIMVQSAS